MAADKKLMYELKTVKYMIDIYCRKNHKSGSNGSHTLCDNCRELYEYAEKRLFSCKFGSGKPACADCPIHCYKPAFRDQIRKVMRFSGPRMIYSHPILAFRHLLKKIKKKKVS